MNLDEETNLTPGRLKLFDLFRFRINFKNVFFQGSLEDTDQPDLILDSGRSQLLTDRDPVLGGAPELCDTAGRDRADSQLKIKLTARKTLNGPKTNEKTLGSDAPWWPDTHKQQIPYLHFFILNSSLLLFSSTCGLVNFDHNQKSHWYL